MANRVLSDSDFDAASGSDKEKSDAPRGSGGSDSSAAARPQRQSSAKTRMMESASSDESEGASDWEGSSKGRKKKLKKKKSRAEAAPRAAEEAEDGELSSAPEDSEAELGSGDDFDGIFVDEEDRLRVEGMTEKEREEEIFRRMEKKEMEAKRKEIERKLSRNKARASRQASDSPPAKRHKTSTDRAKEKAKSSLTSLVALREKKKAKEAKKVLDIGDVFGSDNDSDAGDKAPARRRSSSSSSSDSSSLSSLRRRSDSDSAEDSGEDLAEVQKKQEISGVEQLERCRLSRYKLAKFVHAPFFSKTVIGCFVRVGIGKNAERKDVYRVCQIIDVMPTGKVYQVESTTTNKGLKLRHGAQERVFRLAFVSNTPFTDSEFTKWLEAMKAANHPLPSIEHCERKEKDIKGALRYQYTEKDIDEMVKEKQRFKKNPAKFAVYKNQLMREREHAVETGDTVEADRLGWQLQELEEQSAELHRRQDEGIRAVSWINQKNKDKMKESFLTTNSARTSVDDDRDNPFNRKNNRSKMVCGPQRAVKASAPPTLPQGVANAQAAARAMNVEVPDYVPAPAAAPKAEAPRLPPPPQLAKTAPGPSLEPSKADCLFDAHDFDINIELELGTSAAPSGAGAQAKQSLPVNRRALNLDEYKQKRGLI